MNRPHKILVVDDEPDLQPLVLQRMRREIRQNVYDFSFAQNGVEALDQLGEDESIDIVLSDINMPEMDGLTLLEQIPSVNPNIRSVIVSAYGDMKNIRKAMNRGAFDFITKPIDFTDLRTTIERTAKHLELWRDALAARDNLTSIRRELGIANQMQQSILPKRFPKGNNFEITAVMKAARNVGGDFFDIVSLSDNKYGISVADVSDKGVPAAMFMMSSRTLLKGAAIGKRAPNEVLEEVNRLLTEDNEAGMFVTMIYGIFDPQNGHFDYCLGGHNPILLQRPNGTAEFLEANSGVALGMFDTIGFHTNSIKLNPGEKIIMFTDGITEAMNSGMELYGEERLAKLVAENPTLNVNLLSQKIISSVQEFTGDQAQTDDITCIILSFDGYDIRNL